MRTSYRTRVFASRTVALLSAAVATAFAGCALPEADGVATAPETALAPAAIGAPQSVGEPNQNFFAFNDLGELQKHFPLQRVFERLVLSAGANPQTPAERRAAAVELYQRLWDTNNKSDKAVNSNWRHCNDVPLSKETLANGQTVSQTYECPRAEGALAATDPFANVDSDGDGWGDLDRGRLTDWHPVAITNRFDLAKGGDCGQFRIVYAKNQGGLPAKGSFSATPNGRNFLIFEARAMAPDNASSDLATRCSSFEWGLLQDAKRPNAEFAQRLAHFAFDADQQGVLRGPIVDFRNYTGFNGQIRATQFLDTTWTHREYVLEFDSCHAAGLNCVGVRAHTVKDTSDAFGMQDRGGQSLTWYQGEFLTKVAPALAAATTVAGIKGEFPQTDGAAWESNSSRSSENRWEDHATSGTQNDRLTAFAATKGLARDELLARATSQSCAGCHETSGGRSLGGGLSWPSKNMGFVHVDEEGNLSNVVRDVFIPARKERLHAVYPHWW